MLQLDANDIISLRSPGGDRFAAFMNELIGAHARSVGIRASSISTSIQTNVGDGGVDAEVSTYTERDPTGLMQTPTVWQFKSTTAKSITARKLTEEIEKDYSSDRVSDGSKYFFCITDNLTAEKKHDWEQQLAKAVTKINPQAPAPSVLSADDIANWANSYPAIVIRVPHTQFKSSGLGQLEDSGHPLHTELYRASERAIDHRYSEGTYGS